jgi:short-subunit dehydrogenase
MNTPQEHPLAAVTGASSGIGLEVARELARRGYDIIIGAEDPGITQAAQTIEQDGNTVSPVQIDLSTYDGVEKFYAELKSAGRPLEILVLNAGVGVGGDFTRETDLEQELEIINVNVTSTVHLAKRVLKDMVARNKGRILVTSSIAGQAPTPLEAVYGASKAFLTSFADALRNELKDTEIKITTLMPGPTETNFFHRAGMDDTKVGQSEKDDPAEVAREGVEALMKGETYVVAGSFKNKVFAAAGKIAPDTTAELHRKQAEPVSKAS